MAPGRITAEALWWWRSGIGRTIAVADIGRWRFRHVTNWASYLFERAAKRDDLIKDLIVENKIVGVRLQWQPLQQLARKCAIASVVLGKLRSGEKILHEREEPV